MPTGAQFDNEAYKASVWSNYAASKYEDYSDMYFTVTSANQLTILAGSRCNIASHRIYWDKNETLDFPTSATASNYFIMIKIDNTAKNYTTYQSTDGTSQGDLETQYYSAVAGFYHPGGTFDLNKIEIVNQAGGNSPRQLSGGDINYIESPNFNTLGEEVNYIATQCQLYFHSLVDKNRQSGSLVPQIAYSFYDYYDSNRHNKLSTMVQNETELGGDGSIEFTAYSSSASPSSVKFTENQTRKTIVYTLDNFGGTGTPAYLEREKPANLQVNVTANSSNPKFHIAQMTDHPYVLGYRFILGILNDGTQVTGLILSANGQINMFMNAGVKDDEYDNIIKYHAYTIIYDGDGDFHYHNSGAKEINSGNTVSSVTRSGLESLRFS